jgi:hypothetical protein
LLERLLLALIRSGTGARTVTIRESFKRPIQAPPRSHHRSIKRSDQLLRHCHKPHLSQGFRQQANPPCDRKQVMHYNHPAFLITIGIVTRCAYNYRPQFITLPDCGGHAATSLHTHVDLVGYFTTTQRTGPIGPATYVVRFTSRVIRWSVPALKVQRIPWRWQ